MVSTVCHDVSEPIPYAPKSAENIKIFDARIVLNQVLASPVDISKDVIKRISQRPELATSIGISGEEQVSHTPFLVPPPPPPLSLMLLCFVPV
jgi:hypothetical protein